MASSTSESRPGLRFTWLIAISVILAGIIGAGLIWSSATTTPKLALDLEGGTSITLEPKLEEGQAVTTEQLDQAVAIIRQRVDSTGVSEAEITTQGNRNIVVSLPGNPDEQTRELVRASAQLAFRPVLAVTDPAPVTGEEEAPEDTGPELSDEEQKRLEEIIGDQDATAPQGGGEVASPAAEGSAGNPAGSEDAQAGGAAAPEEAPAEEAPAEEAPAPQLPAAPAGGAEDPMSQITPELATAFTQLDCTKQENRIGGESGKSSEPIVACDPDGQAKYILGAVEIPGDEVTDAQMGFKTTSTGATTNEPVVNLRFNSAGADKFREVTQRLTTSQPPNNQFAIVLDGLVISAPVAQAVITDGRAEISGSFNEESATTLANQLKNGALPISFQVQTEQQISPTLGADYLQKGLIAGLIGLLLVVGYSILQYRALASVTISSLVVAGVLTYLLLMICSWRYGYRLSLAGVAGIIVGIGMTADSFIVYFERIRDEIRSGRNLASSVEVGWDRARQTIYASKAVNMLAAVILYLLAVGSVRGFAFTLGLTVIVDILVVVLFTHPMMQVLARTKFFGGGHPWSGMDPRKLGVSKASYRGAMNLNVDAARSRSAKRGSGKEAKRRQAAADRRRGRDEAAGDVSTEEGLEATTATRSAANASTRTKERTRSKNATGPSAEPEAVAESTDKTRAKEKAPSKEKALSSAGARETIAERKARLAREAAEEEN